MDGKIRRFGESAVPLRLKPITFDSPRKMEGGIAKELYSGVVQSTSIEDIGSTSTQVHQNLHESESRELLYDNDDSSCESSVEKLKTPSDMDKEWQRRHDQFHMIGYRDGLIAGKQASVQEGFNSGFKDSVSIGYNWGLARGITSAMAFLSHGLKEKMVETEETRNKFQRCTNPFIPSHQQML